VNTVEKMVESEMMSERMGAALFGWFAVVALALGIVGVWGLVAYTIAGRMNELGVRLALGAQPGRLILHSTIRAMLPVGAGCAIGLLGAVAGTRLISSYMFGIGRLDPVTFVGSALLLLTVAAAASYLPARRIARMNPINTLKVN
jgi:putative ABC transport system permease protein